MIMICMIWRINDSGRMMCPSDGNRCVGGTTESGDDGGNAIAIRDDGNAIKPYKMMLMVMIFVTMMMLILMMT